MRAATEAGGAASAKNVYYEGGTNTADKHEEQILAHLTKSHLTLHLKEKKLSI